MTEYAVTHRVTQTVEAETPEDAELIARRALEFSADLWWPSVVPDTADVEVAS